MSLAATVLRYITVINFAAFFIAVIFLGGDAINGHSTNGAYFLSSHGVDTQVSSAIFTYSRFHAISTFVLMALAVLSYIAFKPGPAELKWQGRLVMALFVVGLVSSQLLSHGA